MDGRTPSAWMSRPVVRLVACDGADGANVEVEGVGAEAGGTEAEEVGGALEGVDTAGVGGEGEDGGGGMGEFGQVEGDGVRGVVVERERLMEGSGETEMDGGGGDAEETVGGGREREGGRGGGGGRGGCRGLGDDGEVAEVEVAIGSG